MPTGTPEELSRSITGDVWSDLHHTVVIALRRATESELVELLTSNIVRRDQWGRVTFQAENMGRLAAWRLWRLINSRKNAHGYGRRRDVRAASHVEAWDNLTSTQIFRIRARIEQERQEQALREAALAEERRTERADRRERWGLHRFEQPQPQVRDWTREPEHVHQEQQEEIQQRMERPAFSSAEATYQAALAMARADKAARKAAGRG
ncbi:hypothetical protein ACFY15_36310 [Streptomyces sp. NPDC001373]|uniref:hypothetical protein n=1 Tax=Streptomyces sp. NPDC001373 TaxID=3364565 RepID=UPI00369ECD7B